MQMNILSSGPLSTVQDLGRYGYMNTGFSSGGAMDTLSARIANILVGNPETQAVIEMTFLGMTVSFDCDSVIALTGADMQPELNGIGVDMYSAISVRCGDVLSMKMAKSGMRAYLAVSGGFELPAVMGSYSTNLKCKIGGYEGRKLATGDCISLNRAVRLKDGVVRSCKRPHTLCDEITARVMLGPQHDYFTQNGIKTFFSSVYSVSEKSDRMGIRLDGEAVENKNGVDIISDGIVFGSVQIPAAGTPIIMMADRQTTGGYAKVATVISADLPLVAQARPSSKIRFSVVGEKKAIKELKKQQKFLKKLEKKLNKA